VHTRFNEKQKEPISDFVAVTMRSNPGVHIFFFFSFFIKKNLNGVKKENRVVERPHLGLNIEGHNAHKHIYTNKGRRVQILVFNTKNTHTRTPTQMLSHLCMHTDVDT
jgi:hypothetical protein